MSLPNDLVTEINSIRELVDTDLPDETLQQIYSVEEWVSIIDKLPVEDEHKIIYFLGVKALDEAGQSLTILRVKHLIENQINFF